MTDEAREDASDARDTGADLRERTGDLRDRIGDRRDGTADLRDTLADLRDSEADVREASMASGLREGEDVQAADGRADRLVRVQMAAERKDAADERSQAARGLLRGAKARRQALDERAASLVLREAGAEVREQCDLDRLDAQADRAALAHDPASAPADALTGAYQLEQGMQALQDEVNGARLAGQALSVAHIRASGSSGTQKPTQMGTNALMIRLANAIGSRLKRGDLLIRSEAAEYLCATPGTTKGQAEERLQPILSDLAEHPPPGLATIGYAALQEGDTGGSIAARARADGPSLPAVGEPGATRVAVDGSAHEPST